MGVQMRKVSRLAPPRPSAKALANSPCLEDIERMIAAGFSWKAVASYFEANGYKVAADSLRIEVRRLWALTGKPHKAHKVEKRSAKGALTHKLYGPTLAAACAAARESSWTLDDVLKDLSRAGWSLSKSSLEKALSSARGGPVPEAVEAFFPNEAPPRSEDAKRPVFFKRQALVGVLLPQIEIAAGQPCDWGRASEFLAKAGFVVSSECLYKYVRAAKKIRAEFSARKLKEGAVDES